MLSLSMTFEEGTCRLEVITLIDRLCSHDWVLSLNVIDTAPTESFL